MKRHRESINGGQGGSTSIEHPVWDKLWKLGCPNKVRPYLELFFLNFDTVALLFLFDKHCPIIE